MSKSPAETLYDCRKDFIIIGLTGTAGSGCSTLAKMMSFKKFLDDVRDPETFDIPDLPDVDSDNTFHKGGQELQDQATGKEVFRRKYSICYNFATEHYEPFTILKFTHVVWLYIILYYKTKHVNGSLSEFIETILRDKFKPSRESWDNDYKEKLNITQESRDREIKDLVAELGNIEGLPKAIEVEDNILEEEHVSDETAKKLAYYFFNNKEFNDFLTKLFEGLAKIDLYSYCFFNHRATSQIRLTGNLEAPFEEVFDNRYKCDFKHQYDLIHLVNFIIKGYHKISEDKSCRIVIDSLRNSIEAWYLKERYSAFYLISVNNDNDRQSRLNKSVKAKTGIRDEAITTLITGKIEHLSAIEVLSDDFEDGIFAAPNIEQVVADAEIHINNNVDNEKAKKNKVSFTFLSMAEQWMKFSSLILHPGLITPSSEERCMAVAYTSKFNSSCISRQVGAVITNQYHSIRTIGWNDVAYGQIPCGLRDMREVSGIKDCKLKNYCYSSFELNGGQEIYEEEEGFIGKVKTDYNENLKNPLFKGLPLPYCFKTLHNRYEGNKNQVYTRSLHAEENAILQMAKYGGEPLMNGVIYVTASPCELCSKKLYQIGVRKIVYIDPYPGIARQQIIKAGFKRPQLKIFEGAYGATYFKLYQPFMSYKDELEIRMEHKHKFKTQKDLLKKILEAIEIPVKPNYTSKEIEDIVEMIKKKSNK